LHKKLEKGNGGASPLWSRFNLGHTTITNEVI